VSADVAVTTRPVAQERKVNRPKKRWTRFVLPTFTGLVILYLCFPIFVMILYSFNDTTTGFGTTPRVKTQWLGFTTTWYQHVLDIPDLTNAIEHSLFNATVSALMATILGTFLGIALGRYRYRGKSATDVLLFMNISSPEIVLGAALASFFVSLGFIDRGFGTLFLSHVMFSIPFVAITVRARVQGLDRSLENAAMDLYANPTAAFFKVTLPLIYPGILAGGMLAFALSIDDFVITQFVQGGVIMFPTYVLGVSKVGIPPQAFVMATLIFLAGVLLAILNLVLSGRKPAAASAG
jgi:spermidine/putrescine transport system permease protein